MAELIIDGSTIEAIVMPNGEELELGKAPTLQSKSVSYTPTETVQSATVTPDTGYDGLDEVSVSVGAISSAYVGSGVTRLTDSDFSLTDGDIITISSGYASSSLSIWIGNVVPSLHITNNVFVDENTGQVEASAHTSADNDALVGWGYANNDIYGTLQLPTQAATTITPTESAQTAVAAGKYTTGAVTVAAIPSNYVGSGITRRSSSDLTASGATVSVPSGYYASNASKAVASGTEGTPTATKGTVSNHAVTVTPSVTNSAGYISGGTHTGTAVSVSASELVSGSETKTANGTYDVTNLASLVVAVPLQTIYTGTSAPSSSLGSNGDVYIQTA